MPIKGLTNQQAQFPEIGQLRKGGEKQTRKRKDGSEYTIWGQDLDHFRFTSEISDVVAAFEAVYDGQPRMVNVLLPFQYVDENWEAWQEEYVSGGLVHRCDGETMALWQKEDGSYSREPKPCPYASGEQKRTDKNPGCKPTARLKVVIPELRRLAYVTVLTNSNHDIRNLDAQLRALETLRHDLRGIPLQLRRSLKTISTPAGNGKRARRQKWLLSIEAAPTWVDYQLAAQEAAAVPQLPPGMSVHEPTIVDATTGEILNSDEDWDDELFEANDEAEQEPPPPDFLTVRLPAGEYAGKTIGQLLEIDRDYLRVVAGGAKDAEIRESAQAAIEWAEKLQEELPL